MGDEDAAGLTPDPDQPLTLAVAATEKGWGAGCTMIYLFMFLARQII